jgi:hypothetical protein
MTRLTLTHTQRWHARRGSAGSGHMYQGRYKAFLVQDDGHLLTVCRYVERNPLRARLVRRAEAWRWGSLWRRERGRGLDLLSDGPVAQPADWRQFVNRAETKVELDPRSSRSPPPCACLSAFLTPSSGTASHGAHRSQLDLPRQTLTPFPCCSRKATPACSNASICCIIRVGIMTRRSFLQEICTIFGLQTMVFIPASVLSHSRKCVMRCIAQQIAGSTPEAG